MGVYHPFRHNCVPIAKPEIPPQLLVMQPVPEPETPGARILA